MVKTIVAAGLIALVVTGVCFRGWCNESALTVVLGPTGTVKVELSNDTLVRGMQFTVNGAKITEVRTTERTKGFLAKFNEKSGKVLMVSASGINIQPGKGSIAEIICDKPKGVSIADVIIVKGMLSPAAGTIPDSKAGTPQKK